MAASPDSTTPEKAELDPDGIDPELVSLRKPRVSAGPLLAATILVFCGYIMVQLVPDLRFSRQGDAPREVADPGKVADRDGFGPEEFVLMRARPDRSFAVRVSPSGTTDGHRVAPVLGTDNKLWVMISSEPWAEKIAYDDVYRGRLRELDDLPFAASLRSYAAGAGSSPHSVDGAALREALESGASTIRRPAGDTVTLVPSTPVTIAETVAGRTVVRAYLRPDRLPDHETWSAALLGAGITAGEPVQSDDVQIVYHVADTVENVKARLVAGQLYAARAEPLVVERTATWAELAAAAGGVRVGAATVPWTSISAVVLEAPRAVPGDAMVLVTDEAPGMYWYMLPLYLILALFVGLFAWALVRGVVPEKTRAPASKQAQTAA